METLPTFIVTGATQGIGRAVATALSARGRAVVAVGRSQERLASLQAQCGPRLTALGADLSTAAGVERVAACLPPAVEVAGIVHAAGSLVPLEPYERIDPDALAEHFRIHVGAPIALYQALSRDHAIRRMAFVDSYSASAVRIGWSAYSIVKAGAQMAARCAREELARTRSFRVFPGAVNTQIVATVLASQTETAAAFAGIIERGELAEPDEAAGFIVWLLLDAPDDLLSSRDAFDYNNPADRGLSSQPHPPGKPDA
ncbi:Benzil reductase ((S)-benzoin forming) [Pirellulimonas nuda]|uniref:Benzil reductase ((S)-benzoin forming) n=1 Tax=Pirellulimonas nuda TaxID=2528009 RepID=A0A518D5W7_9BACT|nr:SDR family NAD(P)-dependent oxidoreductase [Pirellulimonas nuda]QDU86859.1 Benzil reductase ((S)-benzoin forming) [Pirellulimonas nuda]